MTLDPRQLVVVNLSWSGKAAWALLLGSNALLDCNVLFSSASGEALLDCD